MSDPPPPALPEGAPRPDAPDLSGRPELESALADFRRWFAEAARQPGGPAVAESPPTIDLATLLGHFVALRQEINLQTRAVRVQQEQTADAVGKFQQALDLALRSQARAEQAERQIQDERLRPLLGTLADLYDSLSTAASQIRRVTAGVLPRLQAMHEGAEDGPPEVPGPSGRTARSFWSRLLSSPAARRETEERVRAERERRRRRAEASAEARAQVEDSLSALLAGYTMSLERIDRALRKHGLDPVPTVGLSFDPERMESLDGVAGTGRPRNEVVEEVQRGYTLGGKVFRYARVRVARD